MEQAQPLSTILRDILAKTEWYNGTDLVDYQRRQLEVLLRHAHAHSPFYKERLAPLFRKDGRINWRQWQDIPVLTRAEFQDRKSVV